MKELIKQKLDEQNLKDLNKLLQTAEGRRFFSYLLEFCGRDVQDFKGNSRDVFAQGMRNVAVMLIASVKAIGVDGMDLLHKSEKEYVNLQFSILEELKAEIKKQGGTTNAR